MENITSTTSDTLLGKLLVTSYALLETAHKLQNPESLPVLATNDSSVEAARKTLRWLRNLQNISQDMESWLQIGSLTEQQTKAQWLQSLISIYAAQVKIAQLSNPDLLNHFTIDHANHASGSVATSIAMHTLDILPEESPSIELLDNELDNILPQWDARQSQSVEQLIDAIESGITHLVNKPLGDRSPVDRLIEISNNIQEAVRQLYSIDTLEDPAREESIELAREILRRLKDLSFSDKNIEDAIDTGRPSEKLAFAQRISEMVGMYKNLLFEAMRSNPNIINDVRVKNANDAASDCSSGIKLLAAKEIPANSSSIQQISADLEEVGGGKNLQNSSLNKLMNKMEGGLEQAAEEVSANKKKDKKTSVEAEKAAQAEKVRRRRRRRQQTAVIGNNVPQNVNNAAPQQEAAPSSSKSETKGVGSLNKLDIAAVRQAGSSLRKSNKQANDMLVSNTKGDKKDNVAVAISNVSSSTKIKPDDKGFSARERDANNPNNPRNNRPRIG